MVDHYTYGITSDGDQMEGVASEAASLAGTLGLGKLIFLYDDNKITIEGHTDIAFKEDVGARFVAYGWQVLRVSTSEDVEELAKAIKEAKEKRTVLPSLLFPPILVLAVRARIWPVRTANRWALRMWLPLKSRRLGSGKVLLCA